MNAPEINMFFEKRPSGAAGVAKGLWNRKAVGENRKRPGNIAAIIPDVNPDPSHVRAFNGICRVPDTFFLHPLYPLTHVYPLTVRVLGHKKSGFDIFKSLNVRSRFRQHRKMAVTETLSFSCAIGDRRVVEKGMELDVCGDVTADGRTVWDCCYTFFCRGRFGEPESVPVETGLQEIQDPTVIGEWFLEKGDGFRFAGISGDTNGIHYWDGYARMLGFKKSFAQPVLVVGRSHEAIPLTDMESFSFEQRLKGPVYYNSRVTVKSGGNKTDGRFDIYCENNPKPCISCEIRRMP
jgi:hypothetical protein